MKKIVPLLLVLAFSLTAKASTLYKGTDSKGVSCFYRVTEEDYMEFTFGGTPDNWSDIPLYMNLPLTNGASSSTGSSSTQIHTSYANGVYSFDVSIRNSYTVLSMDLVIDQFLHNPKEIRFVDQNGNQALCIF